MPAPVGRVLEYQPTNKVTNNETPLHAKKPAR